MKLKELIDIEKKLLEIENKPSKHEFDKVIKCVTLLNKISPITDMYFKYMKDFEEENSFLNNNDLMKLLEDKCQELLNTEIEIEINVNFLN